MNQDRSKTDSICLRYAAGVESSDALAVVATAVDDLRKGLATMTGREVSIQQDPRIGARQIHIDFGMTESAPTGPNTSLEGDSFAISRPDSNSIAIAAGSERGLIHAASDLLQHLGARFPPGAPPEFPYVGLQPIEIEPYRVEPSFKRRGFVSDIMTWNYLFADRLELHLRHDREFIPWMARRGANAFSFIRHAHDTRLRIDELLPVLRSHGIASEYGGHVLQIVLPRERFKTDPSMFPADDDGNRLPLGNLCVSNPAAVEVVREGALGYLAEYPENELLHVWGADVSRGAWCRCGSCRERAPQIQYMDVVNAIATSMAQAGEQRTVGYLAYHDTIDPFPGLNPLPNVCLEWAPRERCYSHAIDDPACEKNPRYFDSLKRYLEIFEGRCHVFEYYADAILFGGLAFASPEVVARDMRAYHRLGIRSISCLTFGAYSLLAYPVNLETFVRCAQRVESASEVAMAETARGRHPACAPEMAGAYLAIAEASALVLDYADVMHPQMESAKARRKRRELASAGDCFRRAIQAAESISHSGGQPLARAESQLWTYSAAVLDGIVEYLHAKESTGRERAERGEAAIHKMTEAAEHVRAIDLEIKGTWGAYDLEWIREIWMNALRRGLEEGAPRYQEIV